MYGPRSNDETTSFMGDYIVQGIVLLDVLTFFDVVICWGFGVGGYDGFYILGFFYYYFGVYIIFCIRSVIEEICMNNSTFIYPRLN